MFVDSNPASINTACVTFRKLSALSTLTCLCEKYVYYALLKLSSKHYIRVKILIIDLREWGGKGWEMKITSP